MIQPCPPGCRCITHIRRWPALPPREAPTSFYNEQSKFYSKKLVEEPNILNSNTSSSTASNSATSNLTTPNSTASNSSTSSSTSTTGKSTTEKEKPKVVFHDPYAHESDEPLLPIPTPLRKVLQTMFSLLKQFFCTQIRGVSILLWLLGTLAGLMSYTVFWGGFLTVLGFVVFNFLSWLTPWFPRPQIDGVLEAAEVVAPIVAPVFIAIPKGDAPFSFMHSVLAEGVAASSR